MACHLRRLVSDTKAILITYLPIRVPTGSRVTELPDSGGQTSSLVAGRRIELPRMGYGPIDLPLIYPAMFLGLPLAAEGWPLEMSINHIEPTKLYRCPKCLI